MTGRMLIFVLLAILSACKGGQKESTRTKQTAGDVTEAPLSVNGKSYKGWGVTNFGPQGPVYLSGEDIILGIGDGCTGITWAGEFPSDNYEVTLQAKRVDGNDFFCGMTFPVGNEPCTLIIGGWGGTVVGLSCINGMDASENETTRTMSFEKNRWYSIRLVVSYPHINAFIDSSNVVSLDATGKHLSLRPEVELSRPFGIASWKTTAALRNIEVKSSQKQ